MKFLANPRNAPAGNRSLWLTTYGMELGVLSGVGMTIFAAWLVSRGLPASDIALLVGAIGTAVGAWLAWSQQVYVKKSISRGPDQPTGREQ